MAFDNVAAVYSKTMLERGAGETLLLTEKIKQNRKVYENGSRQTIASIDDGKVRFESGLELDLCTSYSTFPEENWREKV